MAKKFLIAVGVIVLCAGAATAAVLFLFPYNPSHPPLADEAGSTSDGIAEVVLANNQFALDLYSRLARSGSGNENIFYSPYSISSALAMVYEGAAGQTAAEIKSVFHFPESDILRPNFAAIYNDINKSSDVYELRTGNALWAQRDYPLLNDFMDRVENYYGGKAANVDFAMETEKSRITINNFIEEQTNHKILDLIPAGNLNELTRLVLTNAIYFKGTWEWEFDKDDTREMDFKITPTNIIKTPMMHLKPDTARFNYADIDNLQILELPYKGDKISMLILLPSNNIESLERILTINKLSEYKQLMRETKLGAIYLPKFEFDAKYILNDNLIQLGMPTGFIQGKADFSGMTLAEKIWISFVIHQAYVKVDEKGTEAAAATAVGMVGYSMPRNTFKADHPFIFIIQDKGNGNILFMGKMANPNLSG